MRYHSHAKLRLQRTILAGVKAFAAQGMGHNWRLTFIKVSS